MKSKFQRSLLAATLILVSAAASAQQSPVMPPIEAIPTPIDPHSIPLYAGGAAGSPNSGQQEQWDQFLGGRVARNVVRPTITPFLPVPSKSTGAAVIIAPGGAFLMLSMDSEGYDVAQWLANHGIAAFVLKYRLNPSPADSQTFSAELVQTLTRILPPANEPTSTIDLSTPATSYADGLAALAMVRARATQWGIDPERVGFVGFSAGAALAESVALAPDRAVRPNVVAAIYGPMGHRTVPHDAPPLFMAVASDDPLFGRGQSQIVQDWLAAKRPAELHIYVRGGHGFGMKALGSTSDRWIDEFYWFLDATGYLKKRL